MQPESSPRNDVDWEPVIVGAVMTALGLAVMFGSTSYQVFGEGGGAAPGTMPFLAGSVLAISGAEITWSSWKKAREQRSSRLDRSAKEAGAKGTGESLAILAMLVVVVVLGKVLGFPLMVAAFVFMVARFLERLSIVSSAAMAVGTMAFIWVVFIFFLGVRLPTLF